MLAIAHRTRALLERRGYRVAMTRTGSTYRGGNIERAQFCNRRGAALMLRIHADGSNDPSRRGAASLTPAFRRGWTNDVYGPSLRAARAIQRGLVKATGARDLGGRSARPGPASTKQDVPVSWRRLVHDEPDRGPASARARTSGASPAVCRGGCCLSIPLGGRA